MILPKNKSVMHDCLPLLGNEIEKPKPDLEYVKVSLTSKEIEKVHACISQQNYPDYKPNPTTNRRHFTTITIPKIISLKKFLKRIGKGHLFRHYIDPDTLASNAVEIANRVSVTKLTEEEAIRKRIKAAKLAEKGKSQCNFIGCMRVVNQFCKFQMVYFDIDGCKFSSEEELCNVLKLKPNIIYKSYSWGKQIDKGGIKYSYHLVYILDEMYGCHNYTKVYDIIHNVIRTDSFNFDIFARLSTQIIYGSNHQPKVFEKHLYHINIDATPYIEPNPVYTPYHISRIDLNNSKSEDTATDVKIIDITSCQNLQTATLQDMSAQKQERVPRKAKEWLDKDFYNSLVKDPTNIFLDKMKSRCVIIKNECSDVKDPFIYNKDGLLEPNIFIKGKGQRAKVVSFTDGRKKRMRMLVQLYLTMCPIITPEDLVYNVINNLNSTCDWNAQPGKTYSNKDIVDIIFKSYLNVHAGVDIFSEDFINKFRNQRKKRSVNPYYVGLEENRGKMYYASKFQKEIMMSEPKTKEELTKELKSVYPNEGKGKPNSDLGKFTIPLYEKGFKTTEIRIMAEEELKRPISLQSIRKIIKRYEMGKEGKD